MTPVGLELGGGVVAALDGETRDIVEYPIPSPPPGSIPDVFRRVDDPLFSVSVDELYDAPSVREWLRTQPQRHDIWGGHPDGDSPVHYRSSDLSGFDWVVFVDETSPLSLGESARTEPSPRRTRLRIRVFGEPVRLSGVPLSE
ncbi:hypothetical protein C2R22_13855 [Salinigranum rubrum]|uniref:Uncharacterized protein n=1 Tax=Salinigranum rubrum TaxID=755307 RepID=A0A2I8VKZ7_9EURY|nr:hypothetical protein C2R22_13855 [Salinigranum rubrum]